jgi:hypothetical protein
MCFPAAASRSSNVMTKQRDTGVSTGCIRYHVGHGVWSTEEAVSRLEYCVSGVKAGVYRITGIRQMPSYYPLEVKVLKCTL